MATPSHLIRRGEIYYFRRKVPLHLREQMGKEEIRKSLNTSDVGEARVRAAAEAARWEKEFARMRAERFSRRRGHVADKSRTTTPEELFTLWNALRERPRTTVYDFAKASRRFAALFPHLGIERIEPSHMDAFRQALIAEGIAAGTVRKQFGALSAMLELAVEKALLPDNPARGLRLSTSVGEPQTKLAFNAAELRAVFSTPIYSVGERPQGGAGQAAYWLPLLALYTGARLGELGALQVKSMRESRGIKYLELQTEHARSGDVRRQMPLHGDLVRLGFLQFIEMQRRAGQQALFEELRADNKGKLTGNWSKWFARYLRSIAKVEDPRKSFDSFRRSFLEACKKASLPMDIRNALLGRGAASERKPDLERLYAGVQSLHFDIG